MTDIVYTSMQVGDAWQARVQLTCFGGCAFDGKLVPTEKEAEQSAAKQALLAGETWMPVAQDTEHQPIAQNGPDMPKNKLNVFLQRKIGRSLTKEDAVYSATEIGDGRYRATVQLPCCSCEVSPGEAATEKAAHQAAAQAALDHFASEVAVLLAMAPKKPKAKHPAAALGAPGAPAGSSPKSDRVGILQGHMKRSMDKDDVVYTHLTIGDQSQASVALKCLSGQLFAGQPRPTLKAVEQSAAEEAL